LKNLLRKLAILFFLLVLIITSVTFIKIPNKYICSKFQNTQYHKICWFIQHAESGGFNQRKYHTVFFGSSQCYYGINDSILGIDYLNLGMNTPSSDLDFYMKEKFVKSGGESNNFVQVIGGGKVVSFGLHPLMPFLVKPNWLIRNGQSFCSLHFLKYLINRFQTVCDYILWQSLRKHEELNQFKREYGVGYLDVVTMKRQLKPKKINDMEYLTYLDKNSVNFVDEFLHNVKSQWNFLEKNEGLGQIRFLMIPKFQTVNAMVLDFNNIQSFNSDFTLIRIDYTKLGCLVSDSIFWADQGHLNRKGSLLYTRLVSELF
jgi:hypothetical protein